MCGFKFKFEFICLEFELELELERKRNRKRKKTQNPKPKPFRKPKPAQQLIQFAPETSTAARSSFFLHGPTPLHSGPKPGQLNPAAHRFLLPSPRSSRPSTASQRLSPFRPTQQLAFSHPRSPSRRSSTLARPAPIRPSMPHRLPTGPRASVAPPTPARHLFFLVSLTGWARCQYLLLPPARSSPDSLLRPRCVPLPRGPPRALQGQSPATLAPSPSRSYPNSITRRRYRSDFPVRSPAANHGERSPGAHA